MLAARILLGANLILLAGCGVSSEPTREPLVVAMLGRPASIDPHLQDDGISHTALFHIYEGLTAFDGEMRIAPALAASWDNPDDLTWRFRLRTARFHDGRPVEADDVVASLERARQHPASLVGGYLATVVGIRALDRMSVEITTRSPSAILLNKLAFVAILPRDSGHALGSAIGTGPYRLIAFETDRLRLARHDSWWRGPAPVTFVELRSISDAGARLEAMRAGSIDINLAVPAADVEVAKTLPGWRILARTGPLVSYLGLRTDRPPFDNDNLRAAIHIGIDRDRLLAAMQRDEGVVIAQVIGPHVFGHDPTLRPPPPDPQRAKALVAAATGGAGLDFILEVREGLDVAALVAELAPLGLRARVQEYAWPVLLERLQSGTATAWVGGLLAPSGDASDVLDGEFHSRDLRRGFGTANATGIADPQLDLLIHESAGVLDPAKRRGLLQAAVRRVAELAPVVPLAVPNRVVAARDTWRWRPRADGFFRAAEVEPANNSH